MPNNFMADLFGVKLPDPKVKQEKILKKVSSPVKVKTEKTTKVISNKTVPIQDRIKIIIDEVYKILGVYNDSTLVIRDVNSLHDYISDSINKGIIAIDTETNNSLDPISCKLMGLCLYTPDNKNVYVPVNHTDLNNVKLENQVTEEDINKELSRLGNTKVLVHNGKFDYQVIKCTCGIEIPMYWDSMIAARILDENERSAGLKQQYIGKIDPSIEKYSIDHLFEDIPYNYFDPDVFALYAATDAYMTYKLYEWQLKEFNKPDHKRLFNLFMNVEMPVVQVAAEMELTGVKIDTEFSKRLSDKYHHMEDELDRKIFDELKKYDAQVEAWRLTPEAQERPLSTKPNKNGEYTYQKSLSEKVENPINLGSPTQLAIFFYDILKVGIIDKGTPRGTGEEILKKINLPICDLILEKRGLSKLIDTYIDKLPQCVNNVDGRLHAKFNQCGTDTGRFSSSEPNLQNIPSHNKEIRMMFTAGYGYHDVDECDNKFIIPMTDEVETVDGWITADKLLTGDNIISDTGVIQIDNIFTEDDKIIIVCGKEVM